ncbi:MAG TPA: flagellar biosynthesis anti-sigma factor FlgM [Rubrivivax sp.]
MKIGPHDLKTAAVPIAGERNKTLPGASTPPGATEASATVDLSASASLRTQGRGEVAFDQAKVDRMTVAIREGTYKVNAGAIADKLIANAEELLVRTQR